MQVDNVHVFTQAPIDKDLYLKVPEVLHVEDGDNNYYSLNIHRNIYDQKQSGRVWYKYISKKILMDIGLTRS